jgi:hypothetical protein
LIDEFVIRRFDQPDETREFPMGRFEVVSVAGVVLQGRAFVAGDGDEGEMRSGDIFAVPPDHDSWVVGEQAYISLHIHGADRYAR